MSEINGSTGCKLKGTITNDDAAAGDVGEYLFSEESTGISITSATVTQLCAPLSLTEGDWDVHFSSSYVATGVTTGAQSGIFPSVSFSGQIPGIDYTVMGSSSNSGADQGVIAPSKRITVPNGSPVNYYPVVFATFAGTAQAKGRIWARRVR